MAKLRTAHQEVWPDKIGAEENHVFLFAQL